MKTIFLIFGLAIIAAGLAITTAILCAIAPKKSDQIINNWFIKTEPENESNF